MNRRELLEGLILLLFGERRRPEPPKPVAVVPRKTRDGGRARWAIAEPADRRLYEVTDSGLKPAERRVTLRVEALPSPPFEAP